MVQSRIQYILTWVAFVVFMLCSIFLFALSWNGMISSPPSPSLMVLIWILMSASGIYLFMLAVKKAHRQWIDEERSLKEKESENKESSTRKKESSKERQDLDFGAVARKLVRRSSENASLEEVGKELLKNLSRELEIMSGLFYIRKKGRFEAVSSFALSSHAEPYRFKEGEGLTGQVAKNQQIMVLTQLPEDYLEVYSGLGQSLPSYLAIIPLIHKSRTVAVLECTGYRFDPQDIEKMFRIFSRDVMEELSPNL